MLRRVTAIILLIFALAPYQASLAEDYPTWEEIEQAKTDINQRQQQINRINTLLDELADKVDKASNTALKLGAEYSLSKRKLGQVNSRIANLRLQEDKASKDLEDSRQQLGQIITGLFQGKLLSMDSVVFSEEPGDLLYSLSLLNRYSNNLSQLQKSALTKYNISQSLRQQLEAAEKEHKTLSDSIGQQHTQARSTLAQAQEEIKRQREASEILLAQLAALKDTTLAQEKALRDKEEADKAAQKKEEAAAARKPPPSTPAEVPDQTVVPEAQPEAGTDPDEVVEIVTEEDPLAVLAHTGVPRRQEAKEYARRRAEEYGWGEEQWQCLEILWTKESSWQWNAYNFSSGAYGIPQSLPASKMGAAGDDWMTNQNTQIEWGLAYILGRYDTPCEAWAFWQTRNWY